MSLDQPSFSLGSNKMIGISYFYLHLAESAAPGTRSFGCMHLLLSELGPQRCFVTHGSLAAFHANLVLIWAALQMPAVIKLWMLATLTTV